MKLWAFRDLSTGTVRVTSTDPGAMLDGFGYLKQTAGLTGGIGLRALMENLKPIVTTLDGQMGAESYVEIDIGGLTDEQLAVLMTPPAVVEPEPETPSDPLPDGVNDVLGN